MSKSGGAGGNVYDQSAAALGGAGGLYGDAARLVSGSPIQGIPGLFNPAMAQGTGYDPASMAAASAADPAKISAGISGYMNPYTNSVINNTARDMQRNTDLNLQNIGAGADAVGAFGGSRMGIQEALTRSEGQQNIGDMSAGLRHQGFTTAAGLSAQDIANQMQTGQFNAGLTQQANANNQGATNTARQFGAANDFAAGQGNQNAENMMKQWQAQFLSQDQQGRAGILGNLGSQLQGLGETGFNIGQDITGQQGAQGGIQQQLVQQIMDMAGGQFQGLTGSPQQQLNTMLQSLGMNPLSGATTTTQQTTPGMFDYLSLMSQLGGSWMQRPQ